jgi:hypothetical protein
MDRESAKQWNATHPSGMCVSVIFCDVEQLSVGDRLRAQLGNIALVALAASGKDNPNAAGD